MTEKAEGLGKLAQDIYHFLFRFAFHDARRVAALQEEAITHWVPTCKSLKGHADKLVDIELARAFVALEQAMLAFGENRIHQFEDAVRIKLAVDAANVLLKKAIFAREYEGEVFEEGDEAFYLPPSNGSRQDGMLVVLHGAFMKARNFIWKWVFPAAQRKLTVYAPASHRATWSQIDFEWIESMIEKLSENYGLAREKTMVAGLSDGAVAGIELCCRQQAPIRKAAFLAGTRPFNVALMPKIPLYIIHGTEDPIYPIEAVRETVGELRAHTKDVTYRELADVPHSFPYPEIETLMDWFVEDRPGGKR